MKRSGSQKSVRATSRVALTTKKPRVALAKTSRTVKHAASEKISKTASSKANHTASKKAVVKKDRQQITGDKQQTRGALPSASFYPYEISKHGDFEWQFERFSKLIKKFDANDVERLMKAYRFADERHKGQVRADGSVYIIHPLRLANTLMNEWSEREADVVIAGLLHDVIEDTQTTIREVKDAFGDIVAKLVDGMTMWKGSESSEVYLQRILRGSEKLRLIKCADALDNLRSWHECPKSVAVKFPRWWRQTKDYVVPIADGTNSAAAKLLKNMIEDRWYLEQAKMA